jgi:hypothetical protein
MKSQTRYKSCEPELKSPVPLCAADGSLNRPGVGWSRRPLHALNLAGPWGRQKRWNYWCVTDGELLFSVTLSSLDYVGAAFVYLWHQPTGQFIEQTVLRPLARGCQLPDIVDGDLYFDDRRLSLRLTRGTRADGAQTMIAVDARDFGGGPLAARLTVEHPANLDTLNVVIPWSERRFQFTSKQHCLPTTGEVRWAGGSHAFDSSRTFGCLDFGRGVWPYRTTWNWGGSSSRQQGRTIGLNLGGQWTDGTGMTENGVVVDGRLHKIGEVVRFDHQADLMQPWTVHTPDSDYVQLTFTPQYERVAKSNLLVVASEVHQMLGQFHGQLRIDDGPPLELAAAFGWVEEHWARW